MTDFLFQKRPQGASVDSVSFLGWLDALARFVIPGVYTPTLTDVTNLDGSTAYQVPFVRIGDCVVMGLRFDANPTASAATELGISLPVPSDFTNADTDAMGSFSANAIQQGGRVDAGTTNNRLRLRWDASDTANRNFGGFAIYRIK